MKSLDRGGRLSGSVDISASGNFSIGAAIPLLRGKVKGKSSSIDRSYENDEPVQPRYGYKENRQSQTRDRTHDCILPIPPANTTFVPCNLCLCEHDLELWPPPLIQNAPIKSLDGGGSRGGL